MSHNWAQHQDGARDQTSAVAWLWEAQFQRVNKSSGIIFATDVYIAGNLSVCFRIVYYNFHTGHNMSIKGPINCIGPHTP